MKEEKEDNILESFGIAFLVFLLIGSIFEIGLLVFAYINADKVECNWLWCTFTDVRSSNHTSFTETYSECYVNGKQVNCSEYEDRFPDYAYHGWNEINGICPSWNDSKTVSECIEEAKNIHKR